MYDIQWNDYTGICHPVVKKYFLIMMWFTPTDGITLLIWPNILWPNSQVLFCRAPRKFWSFLFCFVFCFAGRTVIPYAFVDVDRIKGMRGIYVATQLTPGPVGKRHLLTLITYDRGGKWQRVRSPTVDNRGGRINCYLVGAMSWFITTETFFCFTSFKKKFFTVLTCINCQIE